MISASKRNVNNASNEKEKIEDYFVATRNSAITY